MNSSGDSTRWVVPSRLGVFRFSTTCPAALVCTRSLASAGLGDVAAKLFQRRAVVGATPHCSVQAATVHVGAQPPNGTDPSFGGNHRTSAPIDSSGLCRA